MQGIYNWVDEIPLSRPKRNIARDFSDGGKFKFTIFKITSFASYIFCKKKLKKLIDINLIFPSIVLMAEVVKHFLPHLVELHNYSAAHSVS